MTVEELLNRMKAAYGLFNSAAAESWGPVFRARFGHREGPTLAKAFGETLASFKPTSTKAYPSPLDFEQNLPQMPKDLPKRDHGPAIRDTMARRREAITRLMAEWSRTQGHKIEGARGYLVAGACKHMAERIAEQIGWQENPPSIQITAAQIEEAESRAISRQRVAMFGPQPSKNEQWQSQMKRAHDAMRGTPRAPLKASTRVEKRDTPTEGQSFSPADTPTSRRMAELAAARRAPKPAFEHRDVAEVA